MRMVRIMEGLALCFIGIVLFSLIEPTLNGIRNELGRIADALEGKKPSNDDVAK